MDIKNIVVLISTIALSAYASNEIVIKQETGLKRTARLRNILVQNIFTEPILIGEFITCEYYSPFNFPHDCSCEIVVMEDKNSYTVLDSQNRLLLLKNKENSICMQFPLNRILRGHLNYEGPLNDFKDIKAGKIIPHLIENSKCNYMEECIEQFKNKKNKISN